MEKKGRKGRVKLQEAFFWKDRGEKDAFKIQEDFSNNFGRVALFQMSRFRTMLSYYLRKGVKTDGDNWFHKTKKCKEVV